MTDPHQSFIGKPAGTPRAELKLDDQQELRKRWADVWLTQQLVNASHGEKPSSGGSLYSTSLSYSAACVFPEAGGPKVTTITYPATLSYADTTQETEFVQLFLLARNLMGRFSLHVLDFARREVSQWALANGLEGQKKRETFNKSTGQILERMGQRAIPGWPRLFLEGKKLRSGWGLPEEAGFFFSRSDGGGRSKTNAMRLFENALPSLTEPFEVVHASLYENRLYSRFALQDLRRCLLECIEHLADIAKSAPCDALRRRTREDVQEILEKAFPDETYSYTNIRSAFDELIALLLQLSERVGKILDDPARFKFLRPHRLRRLTRNELDSHLRELAAASTTEARITGAPLARLVLDAIDYVDSRQAGITSLNDWLETIAALYIQTDKKDEAGRRLVEKVNSRIDDALQRYKRIFEQASEYCDVPELASPEKRHFIARIWLMAAGFQAIWLGHVAGRSAQVEVFILYLNAIISYGKGIRRLNYVEVGLFELSPMAPEFQLCNELLQEFRRDDHFGWQLERPPEYTRMHTTPLNTVHNLYSEYRIHNDFSRKDSKQRYDLNHRHVQLGLPLVRIGAFDER